MSPVPWLAVATVLAAVPPALLFVLVWRDRAEPGARPYAWMLATMVAFDLAYAVTLVVDRPSLHELLYPPTSWLKFVVTVPWILFALEYTGRGELATRRLAVTLLSLPLVAFTLLISGVGSDLMVQHYVVEFDAGVVTSSFSHGPLWLVLSGVGFTLLAAGLAMLLEFAVADRQRYGLQTSVLALGGFIPGLTTLFHLLEVGPLSFLDLTPFAFAVAAPLVGVALVRWDLFGFAPATHRVGQDTAIDDFGDAVVITDEEGRVVDVNSRAEEVIGESGHDLAQRPLSAVFDTDFDVHSPPGTVRLDTTIGHRDFDVATSTVDGPRGGTIGHTLVLHDVTDEKQRRQSSEVINRILRHNLRNAMNAVGGYTRELEAHTDEEGAWMLDRIENQTEKLMQVSEQVRDIDHVTDTSRSRSRFAVGESLDAVAAQVEGDCPDVRITTHVPGALSITATRGIFESVVRYAIETLVAENGTTDPRIVLSATPTDGQRPRIEVTITSNGDPVPVDERELIERGEETPLAHSDDLDLWLVAWGVETLGGDLSFIQDQDRPGISLQLPDFWKAEDDDGTAG